MTQRAKKSQSSSQRHSSSHPPTSASSERVCTIQFVSAPLSWSTSSTLYCTRRSSCSCSTLHEPSAARRHIVVCCPQYHRTLAGWLWIASSIVERNSGCQVLSESR